MNDLKRLLEYVIDEILLEGYYPIDMNDPISVNKVIDKWVEGDKAYDQEIHGWYTPNDIWAFREYTWTRDDARRSQEEWDSLQQSLIKQGWNHNDPLLLMVGKNGKAKVGEGNHRLSIAMEHNIKKIPVRFVFRSNVTLSKQKEVVTDKNRTTMPDINLDAKIKSKNNKKQTILDKMLAQRKNKKREKELNATLDLLMGNSKK